MTGIDIIMRRNDDHYAVQIGPDDHVCSTTHRFLFKSPATEDVAWVQAEAFKNGAAAALNTAAGLTDRFIRGGKVEDLS